ncbi:MAG: DUF2271 domain-containing protein [Clostridia bacterium]|nr:DUF2271 domain-containing protein [Clostridia bacterium]
MKRTSLIYRTILSLTILALIAGVAYAEGAADTASKGIEISFTYQRASTMASNQIAVWVANVEGAVVKTLLVTDFTAGRRGYRNREMSLPAWVAAAEPESMSDQEIDAVSSATPGQGRLTYLWDFTDELGQAVPEGVYRVYVEGTFFWESDVVYTAVIDTANPGNEIVVDMERTAPDTHDNENMITDVSIAVVSQ